jgi:hypothetical protein
LDVLEFVDLCRVVGADPAVLINQYLWHSTQLHMLALLLKTKRFLNKNWPMIALSEKNQKKLLLHF